MQPFALRITKSDVFQNFIMLVIVFASLLVGLETSNSLMITYKSGFHFLDLVIQITFTIEIILRILAFGKQPLLFFKSGWNVFDFIVTTAFYLPFGGPYTSVLRLVRILRVFRLVTALPRLQILVGALIKSIPSIGYVALLLFIQFYIFAIVGNSQFGKTDPENFGTLGKAMMTLFQVITLEGWVEVYKSQPNVVAATIYFISFILLGTMIILNLFIGVIIDGFDEIKKEVIHTSKKEESNVKQDLKNLVSKIDNLKDEIDQISSNLD